MGILVPACKPLCNVATFQVSKIIVATLISAGNKLQRSECVSSSCTQEVLDLKNQPVRQFADSIVLVVLLDTELKRRRLHSLKCTISRLIDEWNPGINSWNAPPGSLLLRGHASSGALTSAATRSVGWIQIFSKSKLIQISVAVGPNYRLPSKACYPIPLPAIFREQCEFISSLNDTLQAESLQGGVNLTYIASVRCLYWLEKNSFTTRSPKDTVWS